MTTRAVGLMILAGSLLMAPGVALAQESSSPTVTKASALKDVRISSLPGWTEALSEVNHFRVLFPGQPESHGDMAAAKDFKLTDASGKWEATCRELGRVVQNIEPVLRSEYQQEIARLTRSQTHLFVSGDVFLYGRLGTDFVIHTSGRIRYVRAFISGRRLYTLSVTRKRTAQVRDAIPADVRQFFDSFAYWD